MKNKGGNIKKAKQGMQGHSTLPSPTKAKESFVIWEGSSKSEEKIYHISLPSGEQL